ncbi:MAG TPA: ornithine carbamoyltransferase, partial [Candidatus Methanoperedenaceae archaeon]|nr:ornithine carbamoyltransferase [Candidatus Methanoperedenaceae archaeon]
MHFLSISDISPGELDSLLDDATEFRQRRRKGAIDRKLEGKSVALLFEKPSTRTRISFEVAVSELGGHAICLNSKDMQLGRGETVEDTAAVMSRYVHAVMARVYSHGTLVKLAATSSVPVINGLSDREHPCQLLADLLTIRENKGKFEGLRFAWIGDGNNVCNSLLLACAYTGIELTIACPPGYEPNPELLKKAIVAGGKIKITNDPKEAANGADVVY